VSNVLLLAVTVAPSFRLAALLLAARHALSKIDVPAGRRSPPPSPPSSAPPRRA
jgi:hypothetical protein